MVGPMSCGLIYNYVEFIRDRSPGPAGMRGSAILIILGGSHTIVHGDDTDADRKRRLLAALVEARDGAGTDPNDLMVFFAEIDRASSSFGGGRLAPPVASV